MKVFISQPMRGLSDQEIILVRQAAKQKIKWMFGEDAEIIDSFFKDAPTEAQPLWYLGKSLQLLSTADVAVFIGDWNKARGCKIEHECAKKYGINVCEINLDNLEP